MHPDRFEASLLATLAMIMGCTGRDGVDPRPGAPPSFPGEELLAQCAVPRPGWAPPAGMEPVELIEVDSCLRVPLAEECPSITTPLPWSLGGLNQDCATQEPVCISAFLGRKEPTDDDIPYADTGMPSDVPELWDVCCYTYVGLVAGYVCGRSWRCVGMVGTAPVVDGAGWVEGAPIGRHPDAAAAARLKSEINI